MKNEYGETIYRSYSGWKAACRKKDSGCTFSGNKDIGEAFSSNNIKQEILPDIKIIGEWDGSEGIIFNKNTKGK